MSFTRREFMEVTALSAAALAVGPGNLAHATSRAGLDDLVRFNATGKLTLMHFADCHAQLKPVYFREPSVNIGIGGAKGRPPHLVGHDFLNHFGFKPSTLEAYAYTMQDYVKLANELGPVGGFAQIATLVKHIRNERGAENCILLDSGDTWQGSYSSMMTKGEDMIRVANELGVQGMCPHWEFTYGADQVKANIEKLNFPFLAHNVVDTEWEEPVFKPYEMYERAGTKVAVIGQAFPYSPIANPRRMFPSWSMGIQEQNVQERVNEVREAGAQVVVLLSHNGMDVDLKLASRVEGIDVILGGHTHDAVPQPSRIKNSGGTTLVCNSGSNGKYLSRMDIEVEAGRMKGWKYRLIPVISNLIPEDKKMANLIEEVRAPFKKEIETVIGKTDSLLYRRGNFNGTFDDVICNALNEQLDSEVSLSPGFRWGASLLPGQDITMDTLYTQTAITYPNTYRRQMSGSEIKTILEDVADNLFNPDPYRQQGGDMVRVGGLRYRIKLGETIGKRLHDIEIGGKKMEANKKYWVSGWAAMGEVDGAPIWEVCRKHIEDKKVISVQPDTTLKGVS
uniref:Putative sulfate thiol esterase SoxB. Putative periplasmic 5'-nucleotidase n=1 Tax=Magnetococcus massalia (strain MO-1) TaxID=451514 RepID=A0A1S7LH08_MAGMO|nr:Putative sulfate thiol esterase SoxB. Putative periplasmic 5'-nucleotidase [Candidatus Magnetococcus massalia]